ncbi:MAG: ABC transporter substrate-binding protein [Anaerolineae bacterium]|nr:ABC transporter substrate-binding protein [Anaerolineae bacterium]
MKQTLSQIQAKFGPKEIINAGVGLAVIALLALFFILWKGEKTIKIGAILSLSGSTMYVGEETRDGMLLAVDQINTWGGVNGQKIELIIADSQADPLKGEAAFNTIEATHHPILYASTLSGVSIALAPLAQKNQVVLIGLATTAPEFTRQNEWVFRYFSTARDEVPPILAILAELRVKNLGVIYIDDAFGRSFFVLARAEFEKAGGVVSGESFDGQSLNFQKQLARLKNTEAIYVAVNPGHLESLFKQVQEAGYNGPILAAGNASVPAVRSLPEANGVYVVAPIIYAPDFLYAREVSEKYEAKYGKPFNHYAAGGYDLIKLLAGLLEGKEISREQVKKLLEQGFTYPGVFGELNVAPGEHEIGFPFHPAQIVNGEVKYR